MVPPDDEPTFDPDSLTAAQRDGHGCVVCHKRWPRPRIRVGRLPDGAGVFACDGCGPPSERAGTASDLS